MWALVLELSTFMCIGAVRENRRTVCLQPSVLHTPWLSLLVCSLMWSFITFAPHSGATASAASTCVLLCEWKLVGKARCLLPSSGRMLQVFQRGQVDHLGDRGWKKKGEWKMATWRFWWALFYSVFVEGGSLLMGACVGVAGQLSQRASVNSSPGLQCAATC